MTRPNQEIPIKSLVSLIVVVAVAYVLLSAVTYVFQRQLMYFPARNRVLPAETGLLGVEEVTLSTSGGTSFHNWYGKALDGQPTVLFFHGNAGNVSHRDYRFRELMARGWGVFMLGYPGYGGSEGSPSEVAFVDASRVAYQHLVGSGVAAGDIVLYGESIGSGVAVQLAADVHAMALVLEAPMASAVDVAGRHYAFLPVALLLKDQFMSTEYIGDIDMPLLVMHGERDHIIPIESGRLLFEHANEPKTFVPLAGGGHNDLYRFPTVEIVSEFLESR